ncbi:hypothetical protein D3C76_1359950 [compost metagenome]
MPGFAMLMRVEPAGRGVLVWGKGHGTLTARFNHALRAAVHFTGDLQAVPVQRRLFRQRIVNIHRYLFSPAQLKRRAEQVTVISPCRGLMWSKGGFS